MRLKKVFAGALAAAMLVCAVAVPAFAAEEVEQENCLTSSYVQMNIPYADFYKAAGVDNASEIDAVTSATKNKTRAGNLAAGSYHVNADGSDITGVSFPVKVLTPWALKNAKQVTDADSYDITVTLKGKLFDLEADGYFYSRLQNPTCDLVAKKICELEGGTAAMLTSSGQAANFFALFNLCEAGDHIVASSTIYGGTFNLISVTMKKMGIDATFVDPLCTEEELNAAFRPNTKVVFGETIANPALTVLDIEKFAKAAHAHGVPLIVDNTFPTPVNCRPFEWGADIVTHSTTKYMDGHGAVLGGAIVDGGKFDWMAHAEKFPGLCTPDDSYHGITYAERFGKEGAFITKATAQLMRDFGSMQSPMNAYMLNLGLESLHVRMQRHCANGMAVAEFLESHPKVAYVNYCGLESSPYHALAEKYLPNGSCGVVSFGLAGGREAASIFMKNLKLAAIETHVADARTCCLNPASSTHRQMNDEQLKAAGVPAELVRMSCGLESSEDLIADIAQALDKI